MNKKVCVVVTQQDSGEGLMIADLQVFGAPDKALTCAQTALDEYTKENPAEKLELNENADGAPFTHIAVNDDCSFMVTIAERDVQE